MNERYDVVVVGGGHNGLVCAHYLAAAGLKVCVLERASVVGGAAVTEEFHPGFRNSVASYTVSLLQRRVIEDMRLTDHGLRLVQRPMANFVPSLDGPGLEFHRSVAETQAGLRKLHLADADRYPKFVAELSSIATFAKSTFLEPPVDLARGVSEWIRAAQVTGRLLDTAGWRRLRGCRELLLGAAGDWLDRWFETDALKGGLGFDAVVGHYADPYAAGTGYLLLHHALGEVNGVQGAWGHAIGGMGAITSAMARALETLGVDIQLQSAVSSIHPDGDGFVVATESERRIFCRAVAGAVHPKLLFTKLMEPDMFPEPFRKRIDSWRSESATFRMNVALSGLPRISCLSGTSASDHYGAGILISPSLEYIGDAYNDAQRYGFSRRPVIELLFPSTLDDSLAPKGAHVASLFCQHFPMHPSNGLSWAELKPSAVDTILDAVTEYLPGFRDAIVDIQAFSPQDLESRFGLVGGDIFHGQMTRDQLYSLRPAAGYAQYRTPMPGLYLCGSGAHPGGGVSGAPGYNAAKAMLVDGIVVGSVTRSR